MKATLEQNKMNTKKLINKICPCISKIKENKGKTLSYIVDGYKYNKDVCNNAKSFFEEEGYIVSIKELNSFLYEMIIKWR